MPPHLWGAHSTQPHKPKVAFTIVGGLYRPTHWCTLMPSRTQTVWKAHWLRVAKLGVAYYTDASNERSLLPGHSTPHRARKIEVLYIIASLVDLAWCRTLSSIHIPPLFLREKKNSKNWKFSGAPLPLLHSPHVYPTRPQPTVSHWVWASISPKQYKNLLLF